MKKLTQTPEILGRTEAAELLRVSTKTIQRMWDNAELKYFYLNDSRKMRRTTREWVNEYIQSRMQIKKIG